MDERMSAVSETQIFLTAQDAYPALERQFLQARSHIVAGFRVFDPTTKLRDPKALEIGQNWYDLIIHTLERGVPFRLILTDFDPVVRPAAHRMTWSAVRRLIIAGEASGRPDLLHITPAMHSARIGLGASIALWLKTMREISHETKRLNALDRTDAERALKLMPLLAPYVIGQHPNLRPNLHTLPRLVPTTHHQKIAVFDGETAYIGGLDLDERRYDTPDHDRPGAETWRDCQILTQGPVVKEAEDHLSDLLSVTAGQQPAKPTKHLIRTLSAPKPNAVFSFSPKTQVSEIEAAHLHHIKSAETLIYIETQFFRSTTIAAALANAANANPALQLLVVLPGAPEDVAFEGSTKSDARYGEYLQATCLDRVAQAFGDRFFAASPAQQRKTDRQDRGALKSAPLIYLHAKVSIFDETAAIVSSANLNGRSLRWDTEVGTTLTKVEDVAALSEKCFAHWLPHGGQIALADIVPTWRKLAQANAQKPPPDRRGFLLPYQIAPGRRFGRNLPGVPEEMT